MKVLNFGSCNIDYVYSLDHIVRPGETMEAHSVSKYPGGKGLNQSVALARSGAEEAVRYASAAAALAVSKNGAASSIPKHAEVLEFIKNHA